MCKVSKCFFCCIAITTLVSFGKASGKATVICDAGANDWRITMALHRNTFMHNTFTNFVCKASSIDIKNVVSWWNIFSWSNRSFPITRIPYCNFHYDFQVTFRKVKKWNRGCIPKRQMERCNHFNSKYRGSLEVVVDKAVWSNTTTLKLLLPMFTMQTFGML